ncbi:hypothetical protein [Pseudonocardia nigra]|uniref:hypothetical protein n=1 Tax=Pseudonocardia nigra TaxID=1921578 RepID=UPI001FE7B000|nr:hypothetical protein [Pseudonocardia nigra]
MSERRRDGEPVGCGRHRVSDHAGRPGLDPDRGSLTVALHAARDQLVAAASVIADTMIDP